MIMDKSYAKGKLELLLRDLKQYNDGEFWREMSRIAYGSTEGFPNAEKLQTKNQALETEVAELKAVVNELKEELREAQQTAFTKCEVCGCETAGTNELYINKQLHITKQKLSEQVAYLEEYKHCLRVGKTYPASPSPELLNKIKADSVREAITNCENKQCDDIHWSDILLKYADKLEKSNE